MGRHYSYFIKMCVNYIYTWLLIRCVCRNLKVNFEVKCSRCCSVAIASVVIEDVDGVLRQMFSTIDKDSDQFYMEIKYKDQLLLFPRKCSNDAYNVRNASLVLIAFLYKGFQFYGYEGYAEGSPTLVLKTSPSTSVSPYQALLMKVDTIKAADFKVYLVVAINVGARGNSPELIDLCD